MTALPCGHVFHKKCVERWFSTSLTCPQCRVTVKRSTTISRLFFDVVPFPSLESSSAACSTSSSPSSQHLSRLSELRDPSIQLFKAKSEIDRLAQALQEAENKLSEQTKLAHDREKEVITLTALYTESDKLCEKERQRSRDLRNELLAMKQFMRDAESMRAEAMKLRTEMDDMQSIKKLITGSEEAARELLARYSSKSETSRCGPQDLRCSLESLCRWTAVLRTELTSTREKARNYRIELSRLRKLHAAAAQRAARSEVLASQRCEQIQALEEQLSVALNGPRCFPSTDRIDMEKHTKSEPPKPVSPDLFSTPEQRCRSKNLHHMALSAELTTPDLLSSSPMNYPSTSELQRRLRTPVENPFRAKIKSIGRLELATSSTIASVLDDHEISSDVSRSGSTNSDLKSDCNKPSKVQRRPSALLEMSIMRRHLFASSGHAGPLTSLVSVPPFSSHCDVTSSVSNSQKRTAWCESKRSVGARTKKSTISSFDKKNPRLDSFVLRR